MCIDGPQVADVNFWALHNPKERFYASKTRQMHASHLKAHDRCVWSEPAGQAYAARLAHLQSRWYAIAAMQARGPRGATMQSRHAKQTTRACVH